MGLEVDSMPVNGLNSVLQATIDTHSHTYCMCYEGDHVIEDIGVLCCDGNK